jgi:hypothetical protein
MAQVVRFYPRQELLGTQRGWREIMPTIQAQIAERFGHVEGVACRSGCAHCCKLQVNALPHDIVDVVEYVRYSGVFEREQRARILARLREVVTLTAGMDADEYRKADVECPFLGADQRCMVYAVRPTPCRSFGSTNVAVCDLSVPDDGSTFNVVPDSLLRLMGTSGLFFVPFLQGCLDWWQGEGLQAPVAEGVPEAIAQVQRLIETGKVRIAEAKPPHLNGKGVGI